MRGGDEFAGGGGGAASIAAAAARQRADAHSIELRQQADLGRDGAADLVVPRFSAQRQRSERVDAAHAGWQTRGSDGEWARGKGWTGQGEKCECKARKGEKSERTAMRSSASIVAAAVRQCGRTGERVSSAVRSRSEWGR